MAAALKFMHGQRWVHMDLRPDNVLIGADGTFKLDDLGSAVMLNGKATIPMKY